MKSDRQNRHSKASSLNRRQFIAASAGVGAGLTIAPRLVFGAPGRPAPSDTVNLAFIGLGGQGKTNLKGFLGLDDVQVVALCDVAGENDYTPYYYRDKRAGLKPALEYVEQHYAEQIKSGIYQGCNTYVDFNEMLDSEPNIDAVVVATPDHIHAVASLAAISRGKHVYCEKPLTHSIYETRLVTEAARNAGVATQMGNHGHSGEGIRLTVEWLRAGAIGPVREVHGWTSSGGLKWSPTDFQPAETPPVPVDLDWERWLGPAAYRPYNPAYAPYRWRGWWDFGAGAIGDMACHNLDPAIWALDLTHPASVEAHSTRLSDETVPVGAVYYYEYPSRGDMPPLTMTWHEGGLLPPRPAELEEGRRMEDEGIYFVGDDGVILCGGWGGSPRIIPEPKMQAYERPAKTIPRVSEHRLDWVEACRGEDPTSSNFDYAGPLTEVVLLGAVALRTGKKIHWDGANMKATNAPEADKYIKPTFREGWGL
jgi:predicted dehydrogenase